MKFLRQLFVCHAVRRNHIKYRDIDWRYCWRILFCVRNCARGSLSTSTESRTPDVDIQQHGIHICPPVVQNHSIIRWKYDPKYSPKIVGLTRLFPFSWANEVLCAESRKQGVPFRLKLLSGKWFVCNTLCDKVCFYFTITTSTRVTCGDTSIGTSYLSDI